MGESGWPVWSYSQYYLLSDEYPGKHKNIKDETWNTGLSDRKDGRVIYQATCGARVVNMDRGTQEEQMDCCGRKGGSRQASAIASAVVLSFYGGISLLLRDLPLKVSPPNILTQGT